MPNVISAKAEVAVSAAAAATAIRVFFILASLCLNLSGALASIRFKQAVLQRSEKQ